MLRDASVVGRGFWPKAVAAICGFVTEDVHAHLRSLEQKEFVRRLGSSVIGGEMQYSFHHALVRDVAYAQIPRAERANKHRLAASGSRRSDVPKIILRRLLTTTFRP